MRGNQRRLRDLVLGACLLAPAVVMGGPAADPGPASDRGPATRDVPEHRRSLERDLAELGRLAQQARKDGDLVRLSCIRDKQERAQGVMEVATGELLVLRDSGATREAKTFAAEKLAAAAEKMGALVEQARLCGGDQAPEEDDDVTRNDLDAKDYIPYQDPTADGLVPPVPPSVDDLVPPVVASPIQ